MVEREADLPPAHLCGAPTRDGTPCEHRLRDPGPCWQHGGDSTSVMPPERRRRDRRSVALEEGVGQTRRIRLARGSSSLRSFGDALGDDLPSVELVNFIAERARRHVKAITWIRLSWRWSTGNCEELASIARELLRVKNYLHQKVGDAVEGVLAQYDWPKVPKVLVRELAERLPLPVDEPLGRALLSEMGRREVREQLMNLDRHAIENWM